MTHNAKVFFGGWAAFSAVGLIGVGAFWYSPWVFACYCVVACTGVFSLWGSR